MAKEKTNWEEVEPKRDRSRESQKDYEETTLPEEEMQQDEPAEMTEPEESSWQEEPEETNPEYAEENPEGEEGDDTAAMEEEKEEQEYDYDYDYDYDPQEVAWNNEGEQMNSSFKKAYGMAGPKRKEREEESSSKKETAKSIGRKIWDGLCTAVSCAAALVGHVIHVFVSNAFLGEHTQLALRQFIKRQLMDKELTDDAFKKDGKEDPGKTERTERSKTEPEKPNPNRTEAEKDVLPDREDITSDLDQNSKDEITKEIFNNKEIREALAGLGLRAEPEPYTDKIYIFQKDQDAYGMHHVYAMSKTDLLNGDAKSLASAMYAYSNNEKEKIECSLKAAIAVASISILGNKEEYDRCQKNGTPMDLSHIDIETDHGAASIDITGSPDLYEGVQISYNGKPIRNISKETVLKNDFDAYKKELVDAFHEKMNEPMKIQIGDGKEKLYIRQDNDKFYIRCNKGNEEYLVGKYSFKSEKDVRRLAQDLKKIKADVRFSVETEAGDRVERAADLNNLAYTVAAVSNGSMQPNRTQIGEVRNTFSGKTEPDGKSHLYLEHTERGVRLKAFIACEEKTDGEHLVIGQYHDNRNLTSQDIYRIYTNIDDAVRKIESTPDVQINYSRDNVMETTGRTTVFEQPIVCASNAHKILQEARNQQNVLDGVSKEYETEKDKERELPDTDEPQKTQERSERGGCETFKEQPTYNQQAPDIDCDLGECER